MAYLAVPGAAAVRLSMDDSDRPRHSLSGKGGFRKKKKLRLRNGVKPQQKMPPQIKPFGHVRSASHQVQIKPILENPKTETDNEFGLTFAPRKVSRTRSCPTRILCKENKEFSSGRASLEFNSETSGESDDMLSDIPDDEEPPKPQQDRLPSYELKGPVAPVDLDQQSELKRQQTGVTAPKESNQRNCRLITIPRLYRLGLAPSHSQYTTSSRVDALPAMHRGMPFLKVIKRGQSHFRLFKLSLDNSCIHWTPPASNVSKLVQLQNITEITMGQKTSTFNNVSRCIACACFSIHYVSNNGKKLSIDLGAVTSLDLHLFTSGLRVLINTQRLLRCGYSSPAQVSQLFVTVPTGLIDTLEKGWLDIYTQCVGQGQLAKLDFQPPNVPPNYTFRHNSTPLFEEPEEANDKQVSKKVSKKVSALTQFRRKIKIAGEKLLNRPGKVETRHSLDHVFRSPMQSSPKHGDNSSGRSSCPAVGGDQGGGSANNALLALKLDRAASDPISNQPRPNPNHSTVCASPSSTTTSLSEEPLPSSPILSSALMSDVQDETDSKTKEKEANDPSTHSPSSTEKEHKSPDDYIKSEQELFDLQDIYPVCNGESTNINVMHFMRKGSWLLKYGGQAGGIYREFWISSDRSKLCWQSLKKSREASKLLLSSVNDIVFGQFCRNFTKHKSPRCLAEISFSILYENRTRSIDLIAMCTKDFELWTEGLMQLIFYGKKFGFNKLASVKSLVLELPPSHPTQPDPLQKLVQREFGAPCRTMSPYF